MKRIVTFKENEGRYDVPRFTLSDNEGLRIEFQNPNKRTDRNYYLLVKHGEYCKKFFSMRNVGTIELSAEWLNQGGTAPLCCELEERDKSGVLTYAKYSIEPLNIQECNGTFEYVASVQELEQKYNQQRRELKELKDAVESLTQKFETIPVQIEQAKREAVIEAAGGDPMGA